LIPISVHPCTGVYASIEIKHNFYACTQRPLARTDLTGGTGSAVTAQKAAGVTPPFVKNCRKVVILVFMVFSSKTAADAARLFGLWRETTDYWDHKE
jgi:hypothetical protein